MNKYADFVDKEAPKKWTRENSLIVFMFVVPLVLLAGWLYEPKLRPVFEIVGFIWFCLLVYLVTFRFKKVVARLWEFFGYFERIVDVADDDAATASKQGTSSNTVSASRQQRGLVTSDGVDAVEVRSRASASSAVQTETLREATSPVPVRGRNGGSYPCRSGLSSMCKCVCITFLAVGFLCVVGCLKQGVGANTEEEACLASNQPCSDIQGNLDPNCRKLSKTDSHDVDRNLLLGKIKYREGSENLEMNLVEELAKDDRWEKVANVRPKLVSNLRGRFKQLQDTFNDIVRKLSEELHNQGYKGKFGWDAYLQGLRDVGNPKLEHVIEDLEEMLDCLKLSRTSASAVAKQRFSHMECGGKTLNLMRRVAKEWTSVAMTFGIDEDLIDSSINIPEECAREMLKAFYNAALTWQDIIDSVKEAGYNRLAEELETALDNYCATK